MYVCMIIEISLKEVHKLHTPTIITTITNKKTLTVHCVGSISEQVGTQAVMLLHKLAVHGHDVGLL